MGQNHPDTLANVQVTINLLTGTNRRLEMPLEMSDAIKEPINNLTEALVMQRKKIINDLIEHLVEERMDKMITIKELSEMTPWSWRQIYNLVWKGKFPIPAYKVGQRICFKVSEVKGWMDGLEKIKRVQAA